jgi:2-oxoglutarate dehydrogenase E1 component
MTPKSLLRHPAAASSLRELAEDPWQPVFDDETARLHPDTVRRLILCSGKVYVDLISSTRREGLVLPGAVAVVRIEQLYLFPADALREVLEGYPSLEEVIWVQEEPENMGAWTYVRPYLQELVAGRCPLHYIGRPSSSSPAEGSSALYAVYQAALVEEAYNMEAGHAPGDSAWLKRG